LALAINLVCFAVLWRQALGLLPHAAATQPASGELGSFVVLLSAAVACGGSLLGSLLPPGVWRKLLPALAPAAMLGAATGSAAWAAGVASGQLWQHLQSTTLHLVLALMWPFSERIVFDPAEAVIGTESFIVQVSPECSGVEGIGLITVVMTAYLISARQRLRFPRALWLLPLAITLSFLGNAVRIASLIAVGVYASPDVALSGFHSKAGWLLFCGLALSLIALAQRVSWFARDELESPLSAAAMPEADASWNPAATYLTPLLALIATSLLTALFSTGFDAWYGLRILAVFGALWQQRRHLPRLAWPPSWHAPVIGASVFLLWLWLVPEPAAERVDGLRAGLAALGRPWSVGWIAVRALGTVTAVPIAEELAFRGFLLRRLIDRDFTAVPETRLTLWAVLGSSLAFALLHPGAGVAAGLAGVAYACAQRARGRLADAIVAHAVTNACIAAYVLLGGADWLWS
jgi:exosortase E/protease (VPEID-CTERM system)